MKSTSAHEEKAVSRQIHTLLTICTLHRHLHNNMTVVTMSAQGMHLGSTPLCAQPKGTRRAARQPALVRATYAAEAPPQSSKGTGMNQLDALKTMSTIVADTGEIESIRSFKPIDCTTNPSLLLKAAQNPIYHHFLDEAVAADDHFQTPRPESNITDILAVNIGCELLKIVPGRVSTECDANLSYDTQATIDKGLRIMDLYSKKGIDPKRIYIKIASTWEGIRACEALQKQGIDTNMTLLFSFGQAAACADAGAALISPFVGRIMDWYKAKEGRSFEPYEDPGVQSVQRIYKYYKQYGYRTIVMAASFRNAGEITELAGCDNITIAPALLKQLEDSMEPLDRKLWPTMGDCDEPKVDLTAGQVETFKKLHGEDQMAVDKLKEGIDGFAKDQVKLEAMVHEIVEGLRKK